MEENNWAELQAKAASTIRLRLAPEIMYTVLNETSPAKLWEILEKLDMSKSSTSRLERVVLVKDARRNRCSKSHEVQQVHQVHTLIVDEESNDLLETGKINKTLT